jgi:hypothetical protein
MASGLMKDIEAKKKEVDSELRMLEDHIYKLETTYLTGSQSVGNLMKGFDSLLTQKSAGHLYQSSSRKALGQKPFKDSERVFTLSSATNRQHIRVEEEEEEARPSHTTISSSFEGSKRKGKLSRAEPKPKKRSKAKNGDEDTDFSERMN